ncbi:hypothetical protein BDV93DRAFT_522760 [Ceratobasidium sp. AG-I]|nr:hypothetical protein BDV93DRAFT_522760 [Ceratobasidium sp. AG-I]
MPELQIISLNWRIQDSDDDTRQSDRPTMISVTKPIHKNLPSLTSGPQHPQLSCMELVGLTYGYMIHRHPPMFSNLRYLKLSCFSELLFANRHLEYLSLDVGGARCVDLSTIHPQATLPSLRTLSLRVCVAYKWFQTLLEVIDAPAVESLHLSCQGRGFQSLVDFFCRGRVSGSLCRQLSTTEHPPSGPQCGPIFPALRHLHLEGINMSEGGWEQLIKAYSTVTEVTLDWDALAGFTKSNAVLPNLSHIRYPITAPKLKLREFLRKGAPPSPIRVSIPRRGTQETMDTKRDYLGDFLHGLVDRVEVYKDDDDFPAGDEEDE